MREKCVLITGSTDGIGRAAALELARRGVEVIIHGRNAHKARQACQQIELETGKAPPMLVSDLSTVAGAESLVAEAARRFPGLDVVINNAGVFSARCELTSDGFELTAAVNYVAPFIISQRLVPVLKRNAPARIINVTSILHRGAVLDLGNFHAEKYYDGRDAYAASKLMLTLFTAELAHRLRGTGVTVNCVHPGGVSTKLLHAAWGYGGIPVEAGAEGLVVLATAPEVERVTGRYFDRYGESVPDPRFNDESLRTRLWDRTEALIGQAAHRKAA